MRLPLLEAEVLARGEFGERTLRFLPVPDFFARLERLGHIPLPPYIDREDTAEDRERYQTVFARDPGSVAAPTAGLHFTDEILEKLREQGSGDRLGDAARGAGDVCADPHRGGGGAQDSHRVVPDSRGDGGTITRAKREGRRVVAVGTTTVRTLEYAAGAQERSGGQHPPAVGEVGRALVHPHRPRSADVGLCEGGECGERAAQPSKPLITPHSGEANIFIYPGYRFRVVDAMLTNFHLPKSTLLMLVSAFAGRERVLEAYHHAVRERYRFFSYGDCMFIER